MKLSTSCALLISLALISGAANAVILITDSSGQLTGANNVLVDDTDDGMVNPALYDVRFVDASCDELFGQDACDGSGLFDLNSFFAADSARNALIDQVFVDGPSGDFDSAPNLTAGCFSPLNCLVFVPWFGNFTINVDLPYAANFASRPDFTGSTFLRDDRSTEPSVNMPSNDNLVYSRWQLSSPTNNIPEPSSLVLLIAAIGLNCFRTLTTRR